MYFCVFLNQFYTILKSCYSFVICLLLFFGSVVAPKHVFAQTSPVKLKLAREISILGVYSIWAGFNYAHIYNLPKIPAHGRNMHITGIDNFASYKLNKPLALTSDITLGLTYIASALPVVFANKQDRLAHLTLLCQSASITGNITQTVKMLVKRNRPYTYADQFQYSKRGDVWSFFSGHSAQAAAVVTTSYLLYRKYHFSDFNHKPLFIGAAVAGIGTAALRIAAGKHFPSDVVIGMLAGAGIAWVNFKIHEN